MNHPKTQHYVPQFLLKGFTGRKKQLQVFDKLTGKRFAARPGNVAAEKGFYDLEVEDGLILTLEPRLADLESAAGAIIGRIREVETLEGMSPEDFGVLAIFTAVQYLRTAQFRAQAADWDRQMQRWLEGIGADPHNLEGYRPFDSDDTVKDFTMGMVARSTQAIAEQLARKDWVLTRAPRGHPFLLGDHPVTLHNDDPGGDGPFRVLGNIGFGVRGIEIYLPLSSRLALSFTCPSLGRKVGREMEQIEALAVAMPHSQDVQKMRALLEPIHRALTDRAPLDVRLPNVLRVNALQVSHAERWLYSSTDDFSLAEEMIEKDERFRRGRRMRVGVPPGARHWTSPDMPGLPEID